MVRLAPRVKKVSINPRVIFDVHLNANSSGRLVFLCCAERLQNIFAETDLCDRPSSTLIFAACAKSVRGSLNLLKNHFSHEECSSTCRYVWMFKNKASGVSWIKRENSSKIEPALQSLRSVNSGNRRMWFILLFFLLLLRKTFKMHFVLPFF